MLMQVLRILFLISILNIFLMGCSFVDEVSVSNQSSDVFIESVVSDHPSFSIFEGEVVRRKKREIADGSDELLSNKKDGYYEKGGGGGAAIIFMRRVAHEKLRRFLMERKDEKVEKMESVIDISYSPTLPHFYQFRKKDFGIQFCNKSNGDSVIRIAINHFEGGKWFRQGWWRVYSNKCKKIDLDTRNKYIYFYAFSVKNVWKGERKYCTNSEEFKFEARECRPADLKGFRRVNLGNANLYKVVLN